MKKINSWEIITSMDEVQNGWRKLADNNKLKIDILDYLPLVHMHLGVRKT